MLLSANIMFRRSNYYSISIIQLTKEYIRQWQRKKETYQLILKICFQS